ncbi:DUF2306 domain-containing protein [Salinactinospora qingdaonensis]|uniref:DUF2306 domain-containing protein n=1 Tax=Salinactinospora qingdaonensis TaxID=702744 RepID=A0ABP7G9M4_9ACTN
MSAAPPATPPSVTLTSADRPAVRSRFGWTLVTLTSLFVVAYALYTYAQGTLEQLAQGGVGLASTYATAPLVIQAAFYVHVVTASVALLLGPWQFSALLRRRFRAAHRASGRVYLVMIAVSGVAALVMAPFNFAGMVGFFGFGGLAVLWLITALRAYRAVRARDFASHQAWMIRNYAFTYAAPMLRMWLGVLILVQVPFAAPSADPQAMFENAYYAVPFLCWVPNMFVAEWLIRRRGLPAFQLPATGSQQGNPVATS